MTDRDPSPYPLWVGLAALLGFGALWWATSEQEPPATAAAARDAGAPDAGPAAPVGPVLEWRVEGRGPPATEALAACLRAAGQGRAVVLSDAATPPELSVTFPGLPLPQILRPDGGGLRLRTPVGRAPQRAAAMHVQTAACLREGAEALVDDVLDRRYPPSDWPRPNPGGGLPVDLVVAVERNGAVLVTRGLARLGLPELGLSTADDDAGRRTLQQAVAALVVGGVPADERLALPAGAAALLSEEAARSAGWWKLRSASDRRVLADPGATPPRPLAALARAEPPPPPPPPPERRAAPAPRTTERPPPRKSPPAFRPDYR